MTLKTNLAVVLIVVSTLSAQVPAGWPQDLTSSDTRSYVVTPGVVSTALEFVLDPVSGGLDVLDIRYQDPALVLSLVRPDAVEVTAANASSLGYTFQTVAPNAFASILGPLALNGNHLWIQLPAGQPPGHYIVKINAAVATVASLVTGIYYSSSNVRAGVSVSHTNARPGQQVAIAAIVLDGANPMLNASVKAHIAFDQSLDGQVALSNFTLVSQTTLADSSIRYVYRLTATNSGSAITVVSASATTPDPTIQMESATVFLGNLGAGAAAQSGNTLIFVKTDAGAPSPASFTWHVVQPAAGIDLNLLDSGTADPVSGDGGYSGVFTPTVVGEYRIGIRVTGVSSTGAAYSRTAYQAWHQLQLQSQLQSSPAPTAILVISGRLAFGDVGAAGTVTSLNTFTIQRKTTGAFDPNVLSWTVHTPGIPITVPLLDSGPDDFTPGDGIYSGVFTPGTPGEYEAALAVNGVASSGAFSRKSLTSFRVNAPAASFVSFTFILDPVSGGQEFLDLRYEDPALVFSLLRPNGLEITAANAVSLGYTFQAYAPNAFPGYLGPLGLSGNHLQIQLPVGQAGGSYIVKIDATAATAASLVWGVYYSSSDVHIGLAAAAGEARVGDVVNFSAIVLDGTLPITGATVKAQVSWDLEMNIHRYNSKKSQRMDSASC